MLWQDQIQVDSDGKASIEIPLNDSLTSFRIVAIAMGGEGRFGTGEASIRTSQDILVFSGLPPLVREGDKFQGTMNLRNTSEAPFDLTVSARLEGLSASGNISMPTLPTRNLHLEPGQSSEVKFEVAVPIGITELHWVIDTKAKEKLLDRLDVKQAVKPVLPVRVLQATLQRAAPQFSIDVKRPENAVPERGGVRVELSSSLVSQLATSQSYMTEYPYSCLEQRTSKAISLNDPKRWSAVVDGLDTYLDHDGLAKFFPDERWGYDILTSYILAISARSKFDIPESTKARMTNGLIAWLSGRVSHREAFARPDRPMRQMTALLALSLAGNGSFKPKMVDDYVDIQPQLWPTSTLITWYQLLLRESTINKRDALLKLAENQIRSRLHAEGNVISFAKDDGNPFWLMTSTEDALARLIDSLSDSDEALVSVGFREDLPRLVQGLFMTQSEGHWDLTTTNAWAAVALRAFSKAFEKEQVTGETLMSLEKDQAKWTWSEQQDKTSQLKKPMDLNTNPATHDFVLQTAKASLQVKHNGTGAPWVMISSRFATPVMSAIKNGMSLERTISPVEQKIKGKWSKGDIVRVDLSMSSTAAQVWVVLNDPIPSGATILGGVGNKTSAATMERSPTDLAPSFIERSFEGMRAYYGYVPDRTWTYAYSFRLNQDGVFELPASRLESMYAPGMFAEVPTEKWTVE